MAGTLTTALGALEDGRAAFMQDQTGGIGLYLDAAASAVLPAGTAIVATGTLDTRYGQRTLRVAEADVVVAGLAPLPEALALETGQVGEDVEGVRVALTGATVGSSSTLSDGIGLWVDDGSGQARVIVAASVVEAGSVPPGTLVTVAGPVGQRDSSGTGTGGHRLHVTEIADFAILPPPTPTPTPEPTPEPTPTPTPTPSPSPSPTASPTAAPTATPAPTTTPTPTATSTAPPSATLIPIAAARGRPIGSRVDVEGIVTAEAGRSGGVRLVALQDGTAGIFVRLPDGVAGPARATRLRVSGALRDPYGQLEIRPGADELRVTGSAAVPGAAVVSGAQLGEAVEGRLVVIEGVADGRFRKVSGGDLTLTLVSTDGRRVRVFADATSGVAQGAIADDGRYRLTGVVGQRASRKGALDGYRIWLRDRGDIAAVGVPPSPSPSLGSDSAERPSATARPSRAGRSSDDGSSAAVSVAQALRAGEGTVRLRAAVTTGAGLLDASGRRIVVEDDTAAIEVLLPAGATGPAPGTLVEVMGTVGRAYNAPRLKAKTVRVLGTGAARVPAVLAGPPGPAHEWRLVRVSGTIVELRRMGSRWRAELETSGGRVPITGMEGAGIESSVMGEGRPATIIGIVKRAHPSASDKRYAVVPRSRSDVSVGPAGGQPAGARAPGTSGAGTAAGAAGQGTGSGPGLRPDGGVAEEDVVDVDLADLAAYVGRSVRAGGFVVDITSDGFELDDGTAVALVVVGGEAAEYLPMIEPEDPLNVIGVVELRDERAVLYVQDPAGIVRVGDLPAPPTPASSAAQASEAPRIRPSSAGEADALGLGTGAVGVATLLLVSIASAAVTLIRRRRLQRALLARVAARLRAVASPAQEASTVAESTRTTGP